MVNNMNYMIQEDCKYSIGKIKIWKNNYKKKRNSKLKMSLN